MKSLESYMAELGYPTGFPIDNSFHRFDRTKPNSGFFKAKYAEVRGQKYVMATFGDWAADEKHIYKDAAPTDPEAAAELQAAYDSIETAARQERDALAEEAAKKALAKWESLSVMGVTPYMERKKIDALYGARIESTPNGLVLCVPCSDLDGKLWGIQRILPDGSKYFTENQRIKGVCHVIGKLENGNLGPIYVGEGYATCCSIYMSTGVPTVLCFNAGNLQSVCEALRARNPDSRIVVCADNDQWTNKPNGDPWNPGIQKGLQAAMSVQGELRAPIFDAGRDAHLTDFNDLFCQRGKDEVARQLQEPVGALSERDPRFLTPNGGNMVRGSDGLTPLPWKKGPRGMVPPPHLKFVETLLSSYGDNIVKQGDDIFIYNGKHWDHYDKLHRDVFLRQFQYLYSGQATIRTLRDLMALFVTYIPQAPVEMFSPRPMCANFLNGTLWLNRDKNHKYTLDFTTHKREDYLLRILPYTYDPASTATNDEFMTMLDRVFDGDEDKAEKIRAVAQMYGSCLMSFWPRLFMLWGKPGTGKSTVALIASRFVSKENLCSVGPTEFDGFNMETMAGKLVNIDTDICTTKPIHDDHVKKIIDRRDFRIRRKNQADILAPIPSTHIFCGNDIPRTQDGHNRAHTRRWTFIKFDAFTPQGQYDKEYWDYCFEKSPEGILNFAIGGLRDLIESGGHYATTKSGVSKLDEWQKEADLVGQFLSCVASGEILDANTKLKEGKGRIERTVLWNIFSTWQKESYPHASRYLNKFQFYALLRSSGLVEKKIDGVNYFGGFDLGSGAGGQF